MPDAAAKLAQAGPVGQAAQKESGQKFGANAASAAASGEPLSEVEASETGRLPAAGGKGRGDWVILTPAAPQVPQTSATILQPLLAGGVTVGKTEAELLAGSVESLSGTLGLSGEAPGLTQLLAEASIGSNAAHRPETPRLIAAQLAEAFAAKGDQKVEVSLNPQELGHVKMRVTASETGITMVIHTERPETGDLMRRHIHELAEEFRRMGYEDVSFEFSGGQADGGQAGQESENAGAGSGGISDTGTAAPADGSDSATQNLRLGSSGVDMRV
ncbi:MAG: flagellar hook-length control protein FliK [Leisingera sp.]